MENTGMFRRIDALGRFVLPKELRRTLNINQNDCLQIFLQDDDSIVLRKVQQTCVICNKAENEEEPFQKLNNKKICDECLQKIKNL